MTWESQTPWYPRMDRSTSTHTFVVNLTWYIELKRMDTIGNCQRPVFSLGVAQHMHKQTNLWKFELNWLRSCEIIMEEKTPLSHKGVCFQMLDLSIQIFYWEKTSFSKTFFSCYFRGRRFSQCFILSTALHCLLPIKFLF